MKQQPDLSQIQARVLNRRLVLRVRAGQNILITLLSFAFSVSGTRLFLELTGYPQIGGGELHIAHVLWGGVLLFAAALIPILFINEWAATLAALLAGLGVGLFIDEVGKFITATNDYFYPSAAPIIYVFFLLTVLLASQIRTERQRSEREKMYAILERFSEVLDHDLSQNEYDDLVDLLNDVKTTSSDERLARLSVSLRTYLHDRRDWIDSTRINPLDRFAAALKRFEEHRLTHGSMKKLLIAGLTLSGLWSMFAPGLFLWVNASQTRLQLFLDKLISQNLIRNTSGLNWFEARVLIEGGMGVVLLVAAGLVLCRKEKAGNWIATAGLIVALTLVNLLVFYFDQFSSIIQATFQFLILLLSIRYRKRFIIST